MRIQNCSTCCNANLFMTQHLCMQCCFVTADGLFLLQQDRMYQGPVCTRVPISTRVLVHLLQLNIVKIDTDIVACLDLDKPCHHIFYVACRELQCWGVTDRRFAPLTKSSYPRNKGQLPIITYSLSKLRQQLNATCIPAACICNSHNAACMIKVWVLQACMLCR